MHIELSIDQFQRLSTKAIAAGFDGVEAFVQALAAEAIEDPRGHLSEQQLAESAVECEQANAAIDAGQGREARDAMLHLGREFGFPAAQ